MKFWSGDRVTYVVALKCLLIIVLLIDFCHGNQSLTPSSITSRYDGTTLWHDQRKFGAPYIVFLNDFRHSEQFQWRLANAATVREILYCTSFWANTGALPLTSLAHYNFFGWEIIKCLFGGQNRE